MPVTRDVPVGPDASYYPCSPVSHRAYTRQYGQDPDDVSTTEGLPFAASNVRVDATGDDNADDLSKS